jgi:tetratricopeptide (TPR) repeat protein
MKINSCKYLFVCIISLSVLFFALPSYADNGMLQVKCLEPSGTPSQNAKIVAFNMINQKAKDKKSDAQGVAEFAKIEDGVYRVYARKDGFVPALYEFAVLKGSTESVTLNFVAGADKKFYFEDPAEEKRSVALLQQGLDAFKQNKFEDAEKLIAQSLEINSSRAEAIYYDGVAFLQQGKFDKATELFGRAAKIAEIMKSTQSAAPSGTNPYDLIIKNTQRLLKQMPSIRGEFALKQKNYDLAVKEYAESIKNSPDDPDGYSGMAAALSYLGKNDDALAAADKAIQLKPTEKMYTDLKNKIAARKATVEFEKAKALMAEGNKLLQDGDAAGSLKKYEEAKGLIKENMQAPLWVQIARAQAKLNQEEAAIVSFKKSLELATPDRLNECRSAFAQFYIDAKKFDEAIGLLTDPKAETSSEQTLMDLTKTWKNREPNFAIAALEKVIKLNPANADAYFELGQLCYIEGKSKDSRTKELLNKYLEIGKDAEKIQGAKDMMVIVNKRSK